jgi:hypothetical protein
MKRLLLCLAAAAMLPVFAQTTSGVKVDPKNNKVGRPVVEKPQVKLMSRDELRACMDLSDANAAEAEAIKAAQVVYKESSSVLLKEKQELQVTDEASNARATALKAERDGILKMYEDIKAAAPKMEKADLDAKNKEYQARAAAFDVSLTAMQADNKVAAAKRKVFSDKVDVVNASFKVLETRTEAHFDKADAWKADCSKKSYDEADEAAIKKERAATAKP